MSKLSNYFRAMITVVKMLFLGVFCFSVSETAWGQWTDTSLLPIIHVDLEDDQIPDEPKVGSRMTVFYNGVGRANVLGGPTLDYSGFVAIEKRGSSSLDLFPKVGYGFELRDSLDEDREFALLGMPEEEDWVLHGPYSDKSLIRNAFVYTLAGEMMDYAPRTRFVELVLGDDYRGVYLLTEKIKRDKNRVDISRLKESDVTGDERTGGYLIKFDKITGGGQEYTLPRVDLPGARPTRILIDYPDEEEIQPEQRNYILRHLQEFERRLSDRFFDDPEAGYAPMIDMESIVDFFLINEVVRNVDGYRLSTFLYKDRDDEDGRLKMGPVWDFNLALANVNYCDGDVSAGWAADFNSYCPDDFFYAPFWWPRIMESTQFRKALGRRYKELRENGVLQQSALFARLDSLKSVIGEEAINRNFDRWPVLGEYVWPNAVVSNSHEEEMSYIKNWLTRRMLWLDGAIGSLTADTIPTADSLPPFTFAPNPSSGAPKVLGLSVEDYPLSLVWTNMIGQVEAELSILDKDGWVFPPTYGIHQYSFRTNRQKVYTGRWIHIQTPN